MPGRADPAAGATRREPVVEVGAADRVGAVGEDEFWTLVASLEGRVEEALFDRLTEHMAQRPVEDIVAFGDILDRAVRAMDLFAFSVQQVWDTEDDLASEPPPLDRDGFLDARAAVVCAGKDVYDRVLADPLLFSGVWDFGAEMLLYVPVEAYEAKTGQVWPYPVPGADHEDAHRNGRTLVDEELTSAVEEAYEERDALDGPTDELPVLTLADPDAVPRAHLPGPLVTAGPEPEPDLEPGPEPGPEPEREPDPQPDREPGPDPEPGPEADSEPEAAGFAEPTGSLYGPFEPVVSPVAAAAPPPRWLVEVVGAYGAEEPEGFLADPAPHFAVPEEAATSPWPDRFEAEVFPAVSARLTGLLEAHGGLGGLPVQRLGVVLLLDTHWDLDLLLRPHSGAVRVSEPDLLEWTPEEQDEAVLALAAHVVVEVLSDYRIGHEAVPELEDWRRTAADLVPFPRGRRP